jgi:hypothetical protein
MTNNHPDLGDSNRYEIRIQGRLDDRWSAWFDGLGITRQPDGTTVIAAPALDQAALHGLLRRVRDAGLQLVSVSRMDPDQDRDPHLDPVAAATDQRPAKPGAAPGRRTP